MIVESIKSGEIYTLKLVTGEEVITRFDSLSDFSYKVYKPLVLSVSQQGVVMTPFLFTAEITGSIDIPKTAVIALAKTDKETAGQYIKGTTGITIPTGGSLGKLY
jgi:hypothetical protein